MKTLKKVLIELQACNDAKIWAGDKTIEEVWKTCNRGDWMLWLYKKCHPDNLKEITLAKAHCANTVRHLMKDKRSTDAIDAAIQFGLGNITLKELFEFRRNAYAAYAAAAAYAAYAAAAAAADSAYAAAAADSAYAAAAAAYAYAAAAAAYAYAADSAAADSAAAYAAAAAYADAYAYDARKTNRQKTADICRKYLTMPIIK